MKNPRSLAAPPLSRTSRDSPIRARVRPSARSFARPRLTPIIARTDRNDVRYRPTSPSRQDRRRLHRQGRQRQVHDGLAPARQQVRPRSRRLDDSRFFLHPGATAGSRPISIAFANPLRGRRRRRRFAFARRVAIARDALDYFPSHPRSRARRVATLAAKRRPIDRSSRRARCAPGASPPLRENPIRGRGVRKGSGCFHESSLVKLRITPYGFSQCDRQPRLVHALIAHTRVLKKPPLPWKKRSERLSCPCVASRSVDG